MQELEYYLPVVDPADIKTLWQEQAKYPGSAFGVSLLKTLLSPGSDVFAVCSRSGIIWVLKKLPTADLLAQYMHDGHPDDVVFNVAATIPFERREENVVYDGLAFDTDEFFKRLRDESKAGD